MENKSHKDLLLQFAAAAGIDYVESETDDDEDGYVEVRLDVSDDVEAMLFYFTEEGEYISGYVNF
jgi:hypothetical protein